MCDSCGKTDAALYLGLGDLPAKAGSVTTKISDPVPVSSVITQDRRWHHVGTRT